MSILQVKGELETFDLFNFFYSTDSGYKAADNQIYSTTDGVLVSKYKTINSSLALNPQRLVSEFSQKSGLSPIINWVLCNSWTPWMLSSIN